MPRILIGNIKGPQGAQGIQGPQGPVGATGPQGPMPDLINNALATEAGVAALDAAMGKTLQDQLTELNSNIENKLRFGGDTNYARFAFIQESAQGNIRLGIDEKNYIYIDFTSTGISLIRYRDGEPSTIWTK